MRNEMKQFVLLSFFDAYNERGNKMKFVRLSWIQNWGMKWNVFYQSVYLTWIQVWVVKWNVTCLSVCLTLTPTFGVKWNVVCPSVCLSYVDLNIRVEMKRSLSYVDPSMRKKGKDLTRSYNKSHYTNRNVERAKRQHKIVTKMIDYTAIGDRLRTVCWSS